MNVFKQVIKNVQQSTALVESSKGNIYPVVIADRIRLSDRKPEVGDIAIIHRVNGRYYLYDFEKRVDETDSYLADVPYEDLYGEY
jgi:hypothetical protein